MKEAPKKQPAEAMDPLLAEEMQRGFLYPRRRKPDYLERRLIVDSLRVCARHVKSGLILDVGCGIKPYETILCPFGSEYVGIDYEVTATPAGRPWSRADVYGDCHDMPFEAAAFDTVVCTQVLEHVKEPRQLLGEMFRVLRPGGVMILSVPMTWPDHEEPYDFYRYTRYGVEYLVKGVGFEIVELHQRGNLPITLVQLLLDVLFARGRQGLGGRIASNMLSLALNSIAMLGCSAGGSSRICLGWTVVAVKPTLDSEVEESGDSAARTPPRR